MIINQCTLSKGPVLSVYKTLLRRRRGILDIAVAQARPGHSARIHRINSVVSTSKLCAINTPIPCSIRYRSANLTVSVGLDALTVSSRTADTTLAPNFPILFTAIANHIINSPIQCIVHTAILKPFTVISGEMRCHGFTIHID
jgi:hypothetical protein